MITGKQRQSNKDSLRKILQREKRPGAARARDAATAESLYGYKSLRGQQRPADGAGFPAIPHPSLPTDIPRPAFEMAYDPKRRDFPQPQTTIDGETEDQQLTRHLESPSFTPVSALHHQHQSRASFDLQPQRLTIQQHMALQHGQQPLRLEKLCDFEYAPQHQREIEAEIETQQEPLQRDVHTSTARQPARIFRFATPW